jgi:hypothetical protein
MTLAEVGRRFGVTRQAVQAMLSKTFGEGDDTAGQEPRRGPRALRGQRVARRARGCRRQQSVAAYEGKRVYGVWLLPADEPVVVASMIKSG